MRSAFLAFAISRLAILSILIVVPLVAQAPKDAWTGPGHAAARFTRDGVLSALHAAATANDANWYLGVARDGYEKRPFDTSRQANWAFFPLHPLLWRAGHALTGSWLIAGLLLANAFGYAALALVWQLAKQVSGSDGIANHATMFAAFWPTAYFAMLPYTESLLFALAALAFVASNAGRWAIAGVAGLLAGATRVNGSFVFAALVVEWMKGARRSRDLLKLLPAAGGIVLFALYLGHITGNMLAFKDIQATWGRAFELPWTPLVDYIAEPSFLAAAWNPVPVNFAAAMVAIASAYTCWRRGWHGIATFTLLTLLAGLSSGTLMSIARYVGVAPGLFLAIGVWLEPHPRVAAALLATSAMMLALLCASYAIPFNVGGA